MKNIQISEEFDALLDKLKDRLDRPKKKIVEQLIHYAYKLKIDPEFLKEGDPSHEIRRTRQELIGFIKTQEKEHLKPLYDQLRLLVDNYHQKADTLLTKDDYKPMQHYLGQSQDRLERELKTVGGMITRQVEGIDDNFVKGFNILHNQLADKQAYRQKVHDCVERYFNALQANKGLTGVKDREKIEEAFKRELYGL